VPIYEYVCQKCHHRFEKIQKFSDPKIKRCPECGGPVEQALHAPAVQFKGSGWYVTDYARKSESKDSGPKKEEAQVSKETAKDKSDEKKKSQPKKHD
jgi:putative FmdB family regulatory protein